MNRNLLRYLAAALCVCLLLGGAGSIVYAASKAGGDPVKKAGQPAAESAREETLTKDETVYVLTGADGTVQKIIVSDRIANSIGAQNIEDMTDLKDIEVVNGDAEYADGAGGTTVWDARGNDICYQGNIDRELPIAMSVTYSLNGRRVTPEDRAGKSGTVTIRDE